MAYGVKQLLEYDKQERPEEGYKFLPTDEQPAVLDGSTTPEENLSGGGVGEFAKDLGRNAQELGQDLWKRSWAGAAIRYVRPRLLYGVESAEKDERRARAKEYQTDWDITADEADDYVQYGIKPNKVAEGEQMNAAREADYIASKGGTLAAMGDYIVNNPGEFGKELAMGITADPELLLLGGAFKGVFNAMIKAGQGAKTAAATATMAEANIGAAVGAGGMALESREATGEVDPEKVKIGGMLGMGAGALIGAGMGVSSVLKRAGTLAESSAGLKSPEIQAAIVQYAKDNKVSMQVAVSKTLDRYGIDPQELVGELDSVAARLAKEAQEADPNFAKNQAMTMEQSRNKMAGQVDEAAPQQTMDEGQMQPPMAAQRTAATKAQTEMEANHIKGRLQGTVERIAEKEHRIVTDDASINLASLVERVARKERIAAYGNSRQISPAEEMLDAPAYRPEPGAVQKPVVTMSEFQETSLGMSKSGKPLTGAALQKRYDKWHREMQADHRDTKQTVSLGELEEIMAEKSPSMKNFFASQARVRGSRGKVPAKMMEGELKTGQLVKKGMKFDPKQAGKSNIALMGLMGGAGFGALLGYSHKHDPVDALKYMIGAGAILALGGKLVRQFAKAHPVTDHIVKTRATGGLTGLFNEWQGQGAVYDRKLMQLSESMRILSGDTGSATAEALGRNKAAKALRVQVTEALEDSSGKMYKSLPDNGKEMYKIAKQYFKDWAVKGKQLGILDEVIENYIPHAYKHNKLIGKEGVNDAFFGTKTRQQAMDTVHRKTRVIPTYKVAKAVADLEPRTLDIAELMTMYGKSADLAVRSNQLMAALKTTGAPEGGPHKLVMSMKNAPKNYVTITHPKFNGWKVHPDIAAITKSMFSANDTGVLKRGMLATSFLVKRSNVALSLFHMKALVMSNLMANGVLPKVIHPLRTAKDAYQLLKGRSPALKAFKETGDSDMSRAIDEGIQNGLMVQAIDDVGTDTFYATLDGVSNVLDKAIGQKYGALFANTLGLPAKIAKGGIKGFEKLNKLNDTFMWDRVYTGMKLQTYMNKMSTLAARYGDTMPRSELSTMAAEFTNDAFGGLNWQRLATNVENKLGNQIAHQITSKGGRQAMQIGMFAPDWTTANLRVFYKAFANKKPHQQVMYMHYQLRGLLMSAIVGDAVTYMATGQHIWEHGDLSKIHLGGGQTMTFSKQFMEPFHWFEKPLQSGINKMGILPGRGMEIATGKKWVTPNSMAPNIPEGGRIAHVLSKTAPIWMQQEGMKKKALSLAGFPVYGGKGGKAPKKGLRRSKGGLSRMKR